MTKTEIAFRAIKGTELVPAVHVEMLAILRTLKLSTDEAVELRAKLRRAWLDMEPGTSRDLLHVAKEVANRYARDYRFR